MDRRVLMAYGNTQSMNNSRSIYIPVLQISGPDIVTSRTLIEKPQLSMVRHGPKLH
jgi:hypothetical protein